MLRTGTAAQRQKYRKILWQNWDVKITATMQRLLIQRRRVFGAFVSDAAGWNAEEHFAWH